MKNLMKVLSGLLILVMACTLIFLLFDGVSTDFAAFTMKGLIVTVASILPIISIALCCFCLERGDDSILLRIIAIYMFISIIIVTILSFFFTSSMMYGSLSLNSFSSLLSNSNADGFGDFLYKVYDFMKSTHLCITLISLLLVVQTNNAISSLIKKIAYGAIIVNVVLSLWLTIKTYMQETLPNVYEYEGYYGDYSSGFNFSTTSETEIFVQKVYYISVIIESFSVVLLFITNYAFSSSTEFVASDLDYDELKMEANKYSNTQMSDLYSNDKAKQQQFITQNNQPKEIVKDSSQTGIMNISNQLGSNSNVGQVQEAAKKTNVKTNVADIAMPFSTGPVINQSKVENTNIPEAVQEIKPVQQEQPQTEVQTQPAPAVVHQDVNELMNQQMQQVQPQPTQQTADSNQQNV